MLTYKELTSMPEWQLIAEKLGDMFAEHSTRALTEERDIAVVRYHKGWIDAINTMIELPEMLFPLPHDDEEEENLPGEPFTAQRKDGSVY